MVLYATGIGLWRFQKIGFNVDDKMGLCGLTKGKLQHVPWIQRVKLD